jgi:DNA-binding NarL/FixJ family response regulator
MSSAHDDFRLRLRQAQHDLELKEEEMRAVEAKFREWALQQIREAQIREREVLDAITQGLNHREVGERLGISPRTVEVHKGRVMDKLGTKSLAELLRRAMQQSK